MGHVVHDGAFRARAGGGQVRPGGLLIVTILNLVLWSVLAALIVHAI
jgi:hypothetical protein